MSDGDATDREALATQADTALYRDKTEGRNTFRFFKIKIDGSLVKSVNTNDQAAAILRAVLGLGRSLGLPVLAEGVETRPELQFLESEQCTEVQGYLLGRPSDVGPFRAVTHGEAPTQQPELPFKRAANE